MLIKLRVAWLGKLPFMFTIMGIKNNTITEDYGLLSILAYQAWQYADALPKYTRCVASHSWNHDLSVVCTCTRALESVYIGIYGVGKAAVHQPALAVLSHKPPGATETICWVGKGIVYDTGGLSIKAKVKS